MKRQFCVLLLALLQIPGVLMAQSEKLIPVNVWNVYSEVTGNRNASAEVLWTESFAASSTGQELYASIDSYTGNASEQVSEIVSEFKSQIANFKKMRADIAEGKGSYQGMSQESKKAYLDEFDNQIKSMEENLAYYSSMDVPQGPDIKELLEQALSHAINHKVYHGVLSLGRNLWAVSESLNEDGPNHLCLGGWGVIDSSGKAVSEFKYDLITESDEAHGLIKYATGYRGKEPKYGLLWMDGTQALPCDYSQIYLSHGNYFTAVYPNATKAFLYDWNMKPLATADICYAEPWTRGTSERKVTYYAAIDRSGKVGVYDDSGKLVVPFIYDRGYDNGEVWIGVNGNFPKKVANLSISYDGVGNTNETRYNIFTWENLTGKK